MLDRAGKNILFDRLTLTVELAQLVGKPLRLGGVAGEQKLGGKLGAAHASGGVDARRENEADLNGGDRLSGKTGFAQQRVQTDKIAVVESVQPALHDGAIFSLHAHDVGNGADGGKRAVAREESVLTIVAAEGENELERDANARKVLERIAAVRAVRVDNGDGVRQRFLALVMVGDDKIDAQTPGKGGLLHAGNAAVDRDDQRHAALRKRADRVAAETVPLLDAAGNVHRDACAAKAQIIGQKTGGGDAVHVIVAEHGKLFTVAQRAVDALDRLVHVLHQKRRVGKLVLACQGFGGLLRRFCAARDQHRRDQIRVARVHQGFHSVFREFRYSPTLILHGPLTFFLRAYCLSIFFQSYILPKERKKVKGKARKSQQKLTRTGAV